MDFCLHPSYVTPKKFVVAVEKKTQIKDNRIIPNIKIHQGIKRKGEIFVLITLKRIFVQTNRNSLSAAGSKVMFSQVKQNTRWFAHERHLRALFNKHHEDYANGK